MQRVPVACVSVPRLVTDLLDKITSDHLVGAMLDD
jgi:hypothetical protein